MRVQALAYRLAQKWGLCANVFGFYSHYRFGGQLLVTYATAILPKALDTSKHLTHLKETFDAKFKDLGEKLRT